MVYKYQDYTYVHDYGRGKLYKGDHLLFKGNAWSGILQFLAYSDNAIEVQEMFKAQLEQRERPKFQPAHEKPK